MRNAILAERIIGLFTDRERAANIVGDLAETAQTRGGVWFWRSVAGAAIGLGWRFAAVFAACAALQMAIAAAAGAILNALSAANHGRALAPIGPALSFSAMLLSGVALYSAFRYGVRDALTRLATATTLVAFAGACLPRTPYAPQAAAAAVLALTIAAACSRDGRRALLAAVVTFVVSAAVFVLLVMLSGGRARLPFPLNYLLIIAVQWLVCSRIRRTTSTPAWC